MSSRTNPLESPRRRRPHDTIATPRSHGQSYEGGSSPHRSHWTMTMPPSPSNCTVVESPQVIRARKLSFDEEDCSNSHHGSRQRTQSYSGGKRHRRLKSSMMLLLSFSTLNLLWWRTPVLSYMYRLNEAGREQEVDHWSLHQSQSEATNRRKIHTKRQATNHAGRRNKLAFASIPKLTRTPLELKLLPLDDKPLRTRISRVVRLDGKTELSTSKRKRFEDWVLQNQTIHDESEDDLDMTRTQTVVYDNDRECVPMEDWQTTFHPTCNSVHEMDASDLLSQSAFKLVSSKGFWRNAWRVNVTHVAEFGFGESFEKRNTTNEFIVLKSLKYIHEPNDETFELSRVDAVSLDQLTKSRFTINIYGFCGTSSLQEFASGDLKGLLPTLEPKEKLKMAMWVAEGVADVHAVDAGKGETNATTGVATLIHNDINMDNVLLGHRDGVEVPLLNDYNIAVFRKKDVKTGEACPFRGRFANPQWMSPEQQERPEDELSTGYLNEKIDVYALGNILYKVAVGNSPWKADYKTTKITPELKGKIARAKLRGAKPKVPLEVRNTTDASIKAVLNAMDWCYRNDPNLRPSAADIASGLRTALLAVETEESVVSDGDENVWIWSTVTG